MQARVIYVDRDRGVEEIVVGRHSIELSALGPGSWCHSHASTDCMDGLSEPERRALAACEVLAFS